MKNWVILNTFWLRKFFTIILPFFILVYCNFYIVLHLRCRQRKNTRLYFDKNIKYNTNNNSNYFNNVFDYSQNKFKNASEKINEENKSINLINSQVCFNSTNE